MNVLAPPSPNLEREMKTLTDEQKSEALNAAFGLMETIEAIAESIGDEALLDDVDALIDRLNELRAK